jgi:hypothetical protein
MGKAVRMLPNNLSLFFSSMPLVVHERAFSRVNAARLAVKSIDTPGSNEPRLFDDCLRNSVRVAPLEPVASL